jgi:hypothetical protein
MMYCARVLVILHVAGASGPAECLVKALLKLPPQRDAVMPRACDAIAVITRTVREAGGAQRPAPAALLMLEHCLDAVHTRLMPDVSSGGGGSRGKADGFETLVAAAESLAHEVRMTVSQLLPGLRDPSLFNRGASLLMRVASQVDPYITVLRQLQVCPTAT